VNRLAPALRQGCAALYNGLNIFLPVAFAKRRGTEPGKSLLLLGPEADNAATCFTSKPAADIACKNEKRDPGIILIRKIHLLTVDRVLTFKMINEEVTR